MARAWAVGPAADRMARGVMAWWRRIVGIAALLVLIVWMAEFNFFGLLPSSWFSFCDGPIATPICIFVTPFACILAVGLAVGWRKD